MNDREGSAPPYAWYVVGVLLIAWSFAYLDRQVIGLLIPALKQDLLLSDTEASLILGFAFAIFFTLAGLPIGRLVDRSNRRNVMIVGVTLWSVMTLACGLADNFWELFAARVGVGVGEACLAPAAVSMLADYFSSRQRGKAVGIVAAGSTLGNSASNFGGGAILQTVGEGVHLPVLGLTAGWQMVFIVFGLAGLVAPLLLLTVREPPRREVGRPGGATVGEFVRMLTGNPRLYLPLFGALAFTFIAGYGYAAWGAVVLMRSNGATPAEAGYLMGLMLLVVGLFSAPLGGFMSDRFARRYPFDGRLRLTWLAYTPFVLGMALFWFELPLLPTIVLLGLFNFLGGAYTAASYATVGELVPNEMRGQLIALYMLIANLAGLGLTPTLVALVTDHVFADDMMVRQSVVTVCLPAGLLAIALATLAMRPYARARAELMARAERG